LYRALLADARFHDLLVAFDRDLAAAARAAGCARCGGVLHSARFRRKPRGAPVGAGGCLGTAPLGNSGVGKSSLAQAGVRSALRRQAWPERTRGAGAWPPAFKESPRWCFLTMKPGAEPLKALVEPFLQTWQFDPTDPRREMRRAE